MKENAFESKLYLFHHATDKETNILEPLFFLHRWKEKQDTGGKEWISGERRWERAPYCLALHEPSINKRHTASEMIKEGNRSGREIRMQHRQEYKKWRKEEGEENGRKGKIKKNTLLPILFFLTLMQLPIYFFPAYS